ncbi:thiolase family protein [Flexistipes sp.]|uniref:thiolase family protein n=1 Tax=Flexistipes sp. TaxID=3088135 RepID=UPI002E239898|nr:thiolase family protein [Flexistipes sp.]
MRRAYILGAYRTAGCKAKKGGFKDTRPDDLAAAVIKGLMEKTGVSKENVEDVIMGCAFPEAEQGLNVARIALLKAGLGYEVPGQTVNRYCSSGLQTISIAAERIMSGFADCIIAGGVESMTMIPFGGTKFSANPGLVSEWPEVYSAMGITAEFVADKYGISREKQDEFACMSHEKAAKAANEGRFADEIIPVDVEKTELVNGKAKKEKFTVDADDGIRADTTVEGLAKLKPVFKADGTVTAGNASQVTDGAAAAVVVSEDFLKKLGKDPIASFLGFSVKGVPPEIMGIGPVKAIPDVLEKTGLKQNDIRLIELNEAFAAQSLAVINELGLDESMLNVNGGAIALGHPLGCTGAKLTATLLHEMIRRKEKYGMVTMCIGEGMGAAGIFENMKI